MIGYHALHDSHATRSRDARSLTSIYLYPSIHLSIYPSIYLSIFLSIHHLKVASRVVPDLLGAGSSLRVLGLSSVQLDGSWAAIFGEAKVCAASYPYP